MEQLNENYPKDIVESSPDIYTDESDVHTNKLDDVLNLLRMLNLPERESAAVKVLTSELSSRGYNVEPISSKRGLQILLLEIGENRYAVWLRAKPITREALEAAEKILRNYEIDGKILVKLVRRADYIRVTEWTKLYPLK
jgi:hypothetical protein